VVAGVAAGSLAGAMVSGAGAVSAAGELTGAGMAGNEFVLS